MTPSFQRPRQHAPADPSATGSQSRVTGEAKTDAMTAGTSAAASNAYQRIDRPHHGQVNPDPTTPSSDKIAACPLGDRPDRPDDFSVLEQVASENVASSSSRPFAPLPESWLTLHATDLIDRLASWSEDLDAREAQLNARIAKQDVRERQFRLTQQVAQTEMEEQQRAINRLRKQINDQARRLAFQV
tara:strand:+ start:119233 stop:119793 length:561 start_codon:yes stop_codon:yes gene_type:complete